MLAYTLIEKKQAGKALTKDEIHFLVNGFINKKIPDYQMSAFLMAVYFRGMDEEEIDAYIDVILNSGRRVRFEDKESYYVDKHSTGGVGDKVSLILAPLAMSTGKVKVPMISGRGLGHSGGTLDKLESIPGFRTDLSLEEFQKQTDDIGCALIGQTDDLCPADKELYALRDVTATVRSIPLICGSILSKKIAEGIHGLVLDVKTGNGAFIDKYEDSVELADKLKHFGEHYGLSVQPVLTDMSQPLGNKIGNWLEVEESLDVLRGKGPEAVREVTLTLTSRMLSLAEPERDEKEIRKELETLLDEGKAYESFLRIAKAQGADIRYLEDRERYTPAKHRIDIRSRQEGRISAIDTYQLGLDAITLGAGRRAMTDKINPRAGLELQRHIGDKVSEGDVLITLYADDKDAVDKLSDRMEQRFTFTQGETSKPPYIYEKR